MQKTQYDDQCESYFNWKEINLTLMIADIES